MAVWLMYSIYQHFAKFCLCFFFFFLFSFFNRLLCIMLFTIYRWWQIKIFINLWCADVLLYMSLSKLTASLVWACMEIEKQLWSPRVCVPMRFGWTRRVGRRYGMDIYDWRTVARAGHLASQSAAHWIAQFALILRNALNAYSMRRRLLMSRSRQYGGGWAED